MSSWHSINKVHSCFISLNGDPHKLTEIVNIQCKVIGHYFITLDVLKSWPIPDVSKGQSGSFYVIFLCGQVRIRLKRDVAPMRVFTNRIHKWHQFVSIIVKAAGNIHNNLRTLYNSTQNNAYHWAWRLEDVIVYKHFGNWCLILFVLMTVYQVTAIHITYT